MLMESWGKLEKSRGKVGELRVKNLADTLLLYYNINNISKYSIYRWKLNFACFAVEKLYLGVV